VPLVRSSRNPILGREDIPALPPRIVDPSAVLNPGAVKYHGRYLLMLRVQTRGRETFLLMASSEDGVNFSLSRRPVHFAGIEDVAETVFHVYDPRLTWLEGACYVMFAADTDDGCRLGTARTTDFETFEFLGFAADPDLRNGVLFPEKCDGQFLRLDRPNRVRLADGVTTGDEIFLSASEDLIEWRPVGPVLAGRPHFWDELIGSGPPPVKTGEGWLHVYHGIATHGGGNIYQAGVVLLDLDDPSRVIARGRNNILEPREPYELVGQVPNVVFPTGLIVDAWDDHGFAQMESKVRIYYGAADTCVCLATAKVGELIAACRE